MDHQKKIAEIIKQIYNETEKNWSLARRNENWHANTTTKIKKEKIRSTFHLKTYNHTFSSKKNSSNNNDQMNNRRNPTIYTETQAPYQSGRSTTEHVFAIKILAEMTRTSTYIIIYLLMLDMSTALI